MKERMLRNERGFTLIEIISVLVILGILAAVAVPRYMDLQDDARQGAAQAAIAEVKARLSMGYAQHLLRNNGTQPDNILAICTTVNATNTLPTTLPGPVDVGADFTVRLAADGTITVSEVNGEALTPAVTDTWTLPPAPATPTP